MAGAPTTRYSLIFRIQDPLDQAAWTEFVAIYEPVVYHLGRRRGLQDADARDLCQDVFRAVAGAAGRWIPDRRRGRFRTWLFRIAKNFMVSVFRDKNRMPLTGIEMNLEELISANEEPASDQFWEEIEREYHRRLLRVASQSIVQEFVPHTWKAFWRTAVDAEPIGKVAKELGVSTGAVYIARSRIVTRLRERVREIEGEA